MFHSENNSEIMKSHIVSLYKRLLIFIVKLQAIINIYCESLSEISASLIWSENQIHKQLNQVFLD